MELPALKLVMAEGPRKGETLDFQPKSTIRIGRVARGNNVALKDPGISSKHLLIGSESGKWTVQDLDSSNGTFLNSSQLPPLTPFDLRDGDTVKLGEITSITVHFGDLPSQLRRNPRRKANQVDKARSVVNHQIEIEEKTEIPSQNVEKLKESEPVDEKPRRGRPRKVKVLDRVPEVDKESENVAKVDEKSEITENRKDANCPISDKELENVRVTRSRKSSTSLISEKLGGENGRITRGRGRRRNLQDFTGLDREGKREDAGAGLDHKEIDDQIAVNDTEKLGSVDLEKMTLGQWFDYMEAHLPKQITEATEKMIEEMRRKAERVHEYMIEQRKAKALGVLN